MTTQPDPPLFTNTPTWNDIDPDRNPFPWDDTERSTLTTALAHLLHRPGITPRQDPHTFPRQATLLLASRYGPWTYGWRTGPLTEEGSSTWCCPSHSVDEHAPRATAARAVTGLLSWRR